MNMQCSSVGHVSSRSCIRLIPSDPLLTYTPWCACPRNCQGSADYLPHQVQGRIFCTGKSFPSKPYIRQQFAGSGVDVGEFAYRVGRLFSEKSCSSLPGNSLSITPFRRRKLNVFKLKSAQGAERSPTEDYSLGFDNVEVLTQSNGGSGESKTRSRETPGNIDRGVLSDLPLSGKLIGEQQEVGLKARPANSADSRRKSESIQSASSDEDKSFEENSDVRQGVERSNFEGTNHESEFEANAAPDNGRQKMEDYGPDVVLDENNKEVEYVTRIVVPRQRYIRMPKVELVKALLLFPNQHETKISTISAYLELVLHAKHKILLEELRADYYETHSTSNGGSPDLPKASRAPGATTTEVASPSSTRPRGEILSVGTDGEQAQPAHCDLPQEDANVVNDSPEADIGVTKLPKLKAWGMKLLEEFNQQLEAESSDDEGARTTASAERFQRNFLKLLKSAQFEGLSAQDLELTAALNSDYLLTLPVAVDWKRASKSNAIIYRRGYAKEQQTGLLLGAKFDYLQSTILRETFKGLTGPLLRAGRWFMQTWKNLRNDPEGRVLAETVERWVEEPLQLDPEEKYVETNESEMDMPIWKAAQQAIPRYEAVLSSAGSRGLLIRRILVRMGLLPSDSSSSTLPVEEDPSALEPHLRPNFLSRVSMKDIWFPASKVAEGKNAWKRLCAVFSVFFTQVTLQEPAFQELVLLYTDDGPEQCEASVLQLQMYKTIPLPDLKIVFPSKKLSFRLIDLVRLDLTTFVGLAAFFCNYHFDDFFSSPSAFTLDVIATSALLVFVTRAALGYKQTWDRYQLLVNKTLYEKTLANGFGVVHFLLDASEEQQFKEAIMVYVILLHQGTDEGMSKEQLANACERFLYYRCKEQTEMPVDNAINSLLEFGLVSINKNIASSVELGCEMRYRALTFDEGLADLKKYWESLPSKIPSLHG